MTIAVGDMVSCEISPAGDSDIFRFERENGDDAAISYHFSSRRPGAGSRTGTWTGSDRSQAVGPSQG
jgi:hypothetical protein